MIRHSDSSNNNHIKSIPSQQDILITEFMKDLVEVIIQKFKKYIFNQPLHEQNDILQSTTHDLNLKVEDQFEKLIVNFQEELQFKSRTSERYYTMGIIKEKMEEQQQTIDQLGQQSKYSQKDEEFQQQLFRSKDQEFLIPTEHQREQGKIIDEQKYKEKDIKLIYQNFHLQIIDLQNKIEYQDNQIKKIIESRIIDQLKEVVQLTKQIENLKEQIEIQEKLHQEEKATMKLQYEKDEKQLQDELVQQQYKIETKYKRAYQQNCFTEDQIVDLQKLNKVLKDGFDAQEKQINQLKSQKISLNQDLNKEKRERAQDNREHKKVEQIIIKLRDNEQRYNRLIKSLEDQTHKNYKEYEFQLSGKNMIIEEQNDYIQKQQNSRCQLEQQIINQQAGFEEQIMIQKIKFYKQLGYAIDEINQQFLTHDFGQVYEDQTNISYVHNLEKNQINHQLEQKQFNDQIRLLKQDLINKQEEQQIVYQIKLEKYKQIVQKDQQALNTQQEEAITKIFEENNLRIQNLQDQHDKEIKQINQCHLSLEQKLNEANQSVASKQQEIELIKQESVEIQEKLQQEKKQIQLQLEKQTMEQEKQKSYDTLENQKSQNYSLLQIKEKLSQIAQLESQIIKQTSYQQAILHQMQEQKQQIITFKKALEFSKSEYQKQQDNTKIIQERLRLQQLEVENSKTIYNIFRQKSQSTDIFESAHQIRVQQSEQKLRYRSQLLIKNKSTSQQFHRVSIQKS